MARLPQPGADAGRWGTILNDFLQQSFNDNGTLKDGIITSDMLVDGAIDSSILADGAVTASKLSASSPSAGNVLTFNGADITWSAPASAPVTSVAGRTGDITLTKADVGLSNVDNTSDANKPISTATQTALDAKLTTSNNLSDLTNAGTARTNLGLGTAATQNSTAFAGASQVSLTVVATQTSNYTAASGQCVPVNATGGSVMITLPAATAGSVVAVKRLDGIAANTVMVQVAGSDTIMSGTGTVTSTSLTMADEVIELRAKSGQWVIVNNYLSPAVLDATYAAIADVTGSVAPVGDALSMLQTLLDEAATGSRVVKLAAGTWDLSGSLFVPSGVELAGVGDATVIRLTYGAPIISEGTVRDCTLRFKEVSTNLLSTPISGFTKADGNSSATSTFYTTGGRWGGASAVAVNANTGEDDYYVATMSVTPSAVYTVYAWQLIESYTAGAVGSRSIWINGSVVTNTGAATTASDVGQWRLRSTALTMGASDTSMTIRLYLPQGTCRWSDPVVLPGDVRSTLDSTGDLLLGGRVENVSTPKSGNLRPTRVDWVGLQVAPRLATSRNGNRPLRVSIFGDSIAERTDSASWMKFISDPGSSDPTLFLGTVSPYSPLPSDWTNRAIGGSTVHLVAAHLAVSRPSIDTYSGYNEMHLAGTALAPPQLSTTELAILCVGQNGGEENNAWIETCVRLLRSANVDVILVATNPMNSGPTQGNDRALAYRQIAEAHQCGLADLNTAFRVSVAKATAGRPGGYLLQDDGSDTVGLVSDTVHPSLPGRKLYAQVIRDAMLDAQPGAVTPPLTQAMPPSQNAYIANWPHVPRIIFDPVTAGTVTRLAVNSVINPRSGWADLTQSTNGAYVLANDTAAAGSWVNFLRFGTDGAVAVSLVIIGDGTTVSFDIAYQGNNSIMRSGVSVGTINGRIATVELYRLADTAGAMIHRQMYVRCTSGNARIIGILLWEPGRAMRYRNFNDSSIQGLRFTSGTWTLANYRIFSGTTTTGQLWGTDGNTSAFEFDFYGTAGYVMLGGNGQAGGIVAVDVDGVNKIASNDLYSSNTEPAYRRLEVTGLAPGFHTMKVYGTGVNASASASPGSQSSRRLIIAQMGSRFENPVGYPEACKVIY